MGAAHPFKITVVGAGYVGLSLAVLLSQRQKVCLLDVLDESVRPAC